MGKAYFELFLYKTNWQPNKLSNTLMLLSVCSNFTKFWYVSYRVFVKILFSVFFSSCLLYSWLWCVKCKYSVVVIMVLILLWRWLLLCTLGLFILCNSIKNTFLLNHCCHLRLLVNKCCCAITDCCKAIVQYSKEHFRNLIAIIIVYVFLLVFSYWWY